MDLQQNKQQNMVEEAQDIYTFNREEGTWYMDLPPYLEQGWRKTDLQLVEGAHKFLNRVAGGAKKLRLRLSKMAGEESAVLELVEQCDATRGGAIYLYLPTKGQTESELFWICDLALLVFGDMPEQIYLQQLHTNEKETPNPQSQVPLTIEQRADYQPASHPASFPWQ